ncbi:MAG: Crp/Fnr family transcriptional regulator [Candidatus Abyssubacteria bacterium]
MDRMDIDLLKEIDIFSKLSDKELRQIAPHVSLHRFSEKQIISMPSDPRSRFYAIRKGRVKLTQVSPEGKELVLAVLGKGDVFGELCLFEQGPQSALVTALEDSEIFAVRCSDLARFMAEDPALVSALGKHVGERIRSLEQKLSDMVFKDVSQRLASLLVDFARDYGERQSSGEHVIEMKITHQDLAGLIGSTRETTTITLNHFRDEGLIDFQRGRIIVRDMEGLETAANKRLKK